MDLVFAWIEDGALGTWIAIDLDICLPAIVVLHTLGMGFLAGTNAAIDLRIPGSQGASAGVDGEVLPLLWIALAVNVGTGICW